MFRLKSIFKKGRTTPLPATVSIGCDADGKWATLKLKDYPPDLCKALAAVAAESGSNQGEYDLPSELWEFFNDLVVEFDHEAPMGRDYHPMTDRNELHARPLATRFRQQQMEMELFLSVAFD